MPTLADLYAALDWSQADNALARWEGIHPESKGTENTGFRYRFRCTLLESALYATDEERMRQARGLLAMAGVWPQVVAFLSQSALTDTK